jgi:hypothetical protein
MELLLLLGGLLGALLGGFLRALLLGGLLCQLGITPSVA